MYSWTFSVAFFSYSGSIFSSLSETSSYSILPNKNSWFSIKISTASHWRFISSIKRWADSITGDGLRRVGPKTIARFLTVILLTVE